MPNIPDTPLSPERALGAVMTALELARRRGFATAEAAVSSAQGITVTARRNDVETIEHHRDKALAITVYAGLQKGSASTTDFCRRALEEAVAAAAQIAQQAEADPCAGLAEVRFMATEIRDLDLDHPWSLSPEQAIELACACESAALTCGASIKQSDGASVSSYRGVRAYANSHGFAGAYLTTRHSLNCVAIGERDGSMQRDHWYTVARASEDLDSALAVGTRAGHRTLARLGARKLGTMVVPILFEAPVAAGLLGHFIAAITGSNLYRKASFLLDAIGEEIFPRTVMIEEQPHLPRALGSAPFDHDGVETRPRVLVEGGVLQAYVVDAYAARKLGLDPTGNAGGVRNLTISHPPVTFDALVAGLERGLLVTELMGFGVNLVTGDYSRGASGFWIEGGAIQYPVEEITIAGNLRDMFKNITAIGSDVDARGNIRSGSILIESMTVAGTGSSA